MKKVLPGLSAALWLAISLPAAAEDAVRIDPTDPQPTCTMCPGTYIPAAELERYTKKAIAEKLIDQQVRDIDIGRARADWHRHGPSWPAGKAQARFSRRTR